MMDVLLAYRLAQIGIIGNTFTSTPSAEKEIFAYRLAQIGIIGNL